MFMLVRVYQHVHKSINSQTITLHQAYIIILAQRLNNYTIHLKLTKQWPLAAVRNNLAAVEQQSCYNDIQAPCNDKYPFLGLSHSSQLDAAWIAPAATSAFYLNNQTRHSNCSLLIIVLACSLQQDPFPLYRALSISKVHKPNLLVTASSNPAETSSNDF